MPRTPGSWAVFPAQFDGMGEVKVVGRGLRTEAKWAIAHESNGSLVGFATVSVGADEAYENALLLAAAPDLLAALELAEFTLRAHGTPDVLNKALAAIAAAKGSAQKRTS